MAKKTETTKKPKRGRPSTLSQEIVDKFATAWSIADEKVLTDQAICDFLGYTIKQYEQWLTLQTKFTYKGKKLTFRGIRTQARASVKTGYITRLNRAYRKAEENNDPATMFKITSWLLEKQFPLEFGNRQKIDMTSHNQTEVKINASDAKAAIKEMREFKKKYIQDEKG